MIASLDELTIDASRRASESDCSRINAADSVFDSARANCKSAASNAPMRRECAASTPSVRSPARIGTATELRTPCVVRSQP